ncbi:MAG: hypothetical protein V2J10_09045 [Wenzhouxiangella sp.]|nr:hypothetical protein [Wenzhouxiangella sp.]
MQQAIRNDAPRGARCALDSLGRKIALLGTLATELAALTSMITALAAGLLFLKTWLGAA